MGTDAVMGFSVRTDSVTIFSVRTGSVTDAVIDVGTDAVTDTDIHFFSKALTRFSMGFYLATEEHCHNN